MSSTPSRPSDGSGPTGGVRVGQSAATATALMMAATLLSRIIGMLRDSIIAAKYGQSIPSDAYNAAFRIPDLLYYLIAGGALSSTFVPVFSSYLQQNKEKSAWKTFSVVTTVIFVVGTVLIGVCEVFAPQLVRLLNPESSVSLVFLSWLCRVLPQWMVHLMNLQTDVSSLALHTPSHKTHSEYVLFVETTIPLVRIVLPAQIFFMMGGLLMGVQNAWGKFLNAAIAPSIYNIGIIFGALVLTRLGLGLSGLMWGALVGAFVGNFLCQLIPVIQIGPRFRPSLAVGYPGAVKVWKLLLPILLGVSLPNIDQQVNSYFAETLSIGSQTAIGQANRVMLIPIGIFAQAMGIAILPKMSAMASDSNMVQLRAILNKGMRLISFVTIPCSALMCVLAPAIVSVLYQHQHFTYSNVLNTSGPLRMYSIGIVFWSVQAVLTRCFYAIQDSRTPVISGTVFTVVFILLNMFVVSETNWGISGLAFMTSLVAGLHTSVLLIVMRRRLRGLNALPLLQSLTRIIIATAGLMLVSYIVKTLLSLSLPPISWVPSLIQLAVAGASGIAAFWCVISALRAPERREILESSLMSRFTRRRR